MRENEILKAKGNETKLPLYTPEVVILSTPEEVDSFAAEKVIQQLREKPTSVLTLPTGNTPVGMYEKLTSSVQQGVIDMSEVTIFNLDEYYPMSGQHPNSYTEYMRRNLINKVSVGDWHIPDGTAPDPDLEATRYQQLLDEKQPIDLAVIGIGPGTTCHIGFNESGSSIDSKVRYVPLDPQTRETNAQLFSNPQEIPGGTLTQGVSDILQAQKILLIAKGTSKAWGVNRSLKGPVSAAAPASYLRLHPAVTVVLDDAAAEYLK